MKRRRHCRTCSGLPRPTMSFPPHALLSRRTSTVGSQRWYDHTYGRSPSGATPRSSRFTSSRTLGVSTWRNWVPRTWTASSHAGFASGLGPRTVHHIRAVLRNALNQAARWGLATRNAASLARPPRVPHRDVRPLTPVEARAFLAALECDRLGPLYTAAIVLGLRQGELLGLTWEDVDLAEKRLDVRTTLQRVDGRYVLVEPKTSPSRRTLPLPAIAVAPLEVSAPDSAAIASWPVLAGTTRSAWSSRPQSVLHLTARG